MSTNIFILVGIKGGRYSNNAAKLSLKKKMKILLAKAILEKISTFVQQEQRRPEFYTS